MSYQEKNITVTFVNFTLILVFYLIRVFQLIQYERFDTTHVFRLWGIVVVAAIVVTVVGIILTHVVPSLIQAIRTQTDPRIDDTADERDKLIDLQGTKRTYYVSSIGGALSMATFVLGQPPLVMFTLLIFFGIIAQMAGDLTRLSLYRRGF